MSTNDVQPCAGHPWGIAKAQLTRILLLKCDVRLYTAFMDRMCLLVQAVRCYAPCCSSNAIRRHYLQAR